LTPFSSSLFSASIGYYIPPAKIWQYEIRFFTMKFASLGENGENYGIAHEYLSLLSLYFQSFFA
jgi:hypothetical protein